MVSFLCVGVCVDSHCSMHNLDEQSLSPFPYPNPFKQLLIWNSGLTCSTVSFLQAWSLCGLPWSMHNLEWEKLCLSPQTKFFKHRHILNSGSACSTRRWFLLTCISHFKVMISSSLPISFPFWSSSCSKNTLSEKQWIIYYSLDKKFGSLSLHWINIDLKMKKKCNGSAVDITVAPNFIFYNSKVLMLLQLASVSCQALDLIHLLKMFWSSYNWHLFLVKLLILSTFWRWNFPMLCAVQIFTRFGNETVLRCPFS